MSLFWGECLPKKDKKRPYSRQKKPASPLLWRVKFIGEIGHKEKNNFLKNALALFALIQWSEPFGLFVIEAMACGTPVIATPKGALPELIINNTTGFFVNNPHEAAKKLLAISRISRNKCREHVEKNFSLETMAENYEKAYYTILGV